jgi:hypothetical protein
LNWLNDGISQFKWSGLLRLFSRSLSPDLFFYTFGVGWPSQSSRDRHSYNR